MRCARVVLAGLGAMALMAPASAVADVNVSVVEGTLTITGSTGDDDIAIGSAGSNALGPTTQVTGGPGAGDATFGGEGDDAIMLRDGLADACPSGGPGTNTFDLDLADQFFIFGTGFSFPAASSRGWSSCPSPRSRTSGRSTRARTCGWPRPRPRCGGPACASA